MTHQQEGGRKKKSHAHRRIRRIKKKAAPASFTHGGKGRQLREFEKEEKIKNSIIPRLTLQLKKRGKEEERA